MRITTSDRLLCLLSDSLENLIFPELQSARAKATVEFIRTTLIELRKREHETPSLLAQEIADGRALLASMQALLGAPAIPWQAGTRPGHFGDTIDEHARLTAALADAALALQGLRGKAREQDSISALLLRAAQWEQQYGLHQRQMPQPPRTEPEADASTGPLTSSALQDFLRNVHPDGDAVSVTSFAAIPGGFGKQTSRFTLCDAQGRDHELIARKMDPAPLMQAGGFDITREFELLKELSATGYPAPRPLYLGVNVPQVDAPFYVMERLPGSVPGTYLTGMHSKPSEALVLDIAAQMARLHALPLNAVSAYIHRHEDPALLRGAMSVRDCYAAKLAALRRYQLQEVEHLPSPALTYLADWLERQLPDDDRAPVLVHGDFNIHNLLVDGDSVSGVLDWECAMFGAPEQELAYIQPHISQLIDWERFLAHYEHCSGRKVDRQLMAYTLAFSMLPVNIAMNRGIRNVQSGLNRDMRYTMIELAYGPQFLHMALAATGA